MTENSKPTTISAAELSDNVEIWEARKNAGECNFIWKDDHIDGIGELNGRYVIEYGGIVNDPDIVQGDAIIQIEWLPQPATAQPVTGARQIPIDVHLDYRSQKINELQAELAALREQVARLTNEKAGLRGALEFYADPKGYVEYQNSYSMEPENFVEYTPVLNDGGKRAAAALAETEDDGEIPF